MGETHDASHPLPAREALRRYWRYLIPFALNPALMHVFLLLHPAGHLDQWDLVFAGYFFASAALPQWLLARRKVRDSFFLVTTGVFFSSGVITMLVVSLAKAIIAW